jgi:glycosyltransferase involved in cell wall biosynthesis
MPMKVLFVSRAYPPVSGGIENQNHALHAWLARHTPVTLIANRRGKRALPWFLPYATFKACVALRRHDVLLLGDGVLAVTGFLAKLLYPKKAVVSVVHGLDITYANFLYRGLWVRRFLRALDGLIAVSRATRENAIEQGIAADKVTVIPNGIDPQALGGTYSRGDLERLLGEPLDGKFVLLTTGRLVKRKGAEWFIRSVLPLLRPSVLYVLAGAGPEEASIRNAVKALGFEQRVRLLGHVSDRERDILLHTAEVFVQPNIRVPGDMEGFGIAVVEAAACARPVVAANIEGLKDAIRHQENGLLIEAENADAFRAAITGLLDEEGARKALGARAREFTLAHYHWDAVSRRYEDFLTTLIRRCP